MKSSHNKILLVLSMFFLVALTVVIICAFQRGLAEHPGLTDIKSIRVSIEGFTEAKDLKERMRYVGKSDEIQKKMRSYLIIPFTGRKIINQEITLKEFSVDLRGNVKKATVEQRLTYISEDEGKQHERVTIFMLVGNEKWLISDFETVIGEK